MLEVIVLVLVFVQLIVLGVAKTVVLGFARSVARSVSWLRSERPQMGRLTSVNGSQYVLFFRYCSSIILTDLRVRAV